MSKLTATLPISLEQRGEPSPHSGHFSWNDPPPSSSPWAAPSSQPRQPPWKVQNPLRVPHFAS